MSKHYMFRHYYGFSRRTLLPTETTPPQPALFQFPHVNLQPKTISFPDPSSPGPVEKPTLAYRAGWLHNNRRCGSGSTVLQQHKLAMISRIALAVLGISALAIFTLLAAESPSLRNALRSNSEKAVLARLAEIQSAAEALDPDKVFSFVLENDQGALVQNGKLFLTRQEALESTRQGFQGLKKIEYKFDRQNVTFLSSTVALAVGEGGTSVEVQDGRTFNRRFAQSVLLVLTNGEWRVFHSHRSFPPAQ